MTKFCLSVDIQELITCATLCDYRLRGLGVARGRISHFPIDLRRRPYNTLALPCECVIFVINGFFFPFRSHVLQFFSEYPAISGHQLLLEWHGSAMISRIVWEFVAVVKVRGPGGSAPAPILAPLQ